MPSSPTPDRLASIPERLCRAHGERDFLNPPWEGAALRVLIARLSPFRDVERSTPHQFLYREIRDAARADSVEAYVDFCFFPAERDRAWRSANGVPWLLGVASKRGAAEFDVLLVSNAYTLELVNLPLALERSGLPASRAGRDRLAESGERFPVVALGGSNAMASGAANEPGGDGFADCVFFGEGEGRAGRLALELAAAATLGHRERLAALDGIAARTEGLWHARSLAPVRQARALGTGWPETPPPALSGEEASTLRLEITRGCPGFCGFCFEGWERKPYREHSLDGLLAEAKRLKAAVGADTVELASYNFNAHAEIAALLRGLNGMFLRVNAMSQRADLVASVARLASLEALADKRSFTLGVEGISARARAYYRKELTEAQALLAFRKLAAEDPREISLFYVLSGFEDRADLDDFARFVAAVAELAAARPKPPRVILSVGALVRMPFTPLGLERLFLDPEPYEAVAGRMKELAEARGFEFRGPADWDEYRLSQVLALAPAGCVGLLAAMAEKGFCFDRRLSPGAWKFARAWLDARGMAGPEFLERKGPSYRFPLAHVAPAVSPGFLRERFDEARLRYDGPGAGPADANCFEGEGCLGCQACADRDERDFLTGHSIRGATAADLEALAAIMERKRRPFSLWIEADLPEALAPAHPRLAAARFAAGLMASLPALADSFLGATDAFLKPEDGGERLPMSWGRTWYRVAFMAAPDPKALADVGYPSRDTPPELSGLEVRCSLACPPAAAASLASAFLNEAGMPFTLVKDAEGTRFLIAEKGKKKRNVLSARVVAEGGASVLELACGPKYDLSRLAGLAASRSIPCTMRVIPGIR